MRNSLVSVIAFSLLFLIFSNLTLSMDVKNVKEVMVDYDASMYFECYTTCKQVDVTLSLLPQVAECKNASTVQDAFGNRNLEVYFDRIDGEEVYSYGCKFKSIADESFWSKVAEFPSKRLNEEVKIYLYQTNLTELNEQIVSEVNDVVSGSKSLEEVIARLTDWIHGLVKYDLEFGDKMLTAREVWKVRRGTCDEYAHLLMGALRSLGIPARYVSGYAYTGSVFQPHAWVEVWDGDKWVSADPTFNEVGVDAFHIKLFHAPDGSYKSLKVSYKSDSLNSLSVSEPNVTIKFSEVSYRQEFLRVEVKKPQKTIGSETYFLVSVKVINPTEKYVVTTVEVSKPQELGIAYGKDSTLIYLEPRSSSEVFYIFKTPKLSKGLVYTFPLKFTFTYAKPVEINVTAKVGGALSNLDELSRRVKKSELSLKYDIELLNISVPEVSFRNETQVDVLLKNVGNTKSNVTIKVSCCNQVKKWHKELMINEVTNVTFPVKLPKKSNELNVTIELNGRQVYVEKFLVERRNPVNFSVSVEKSRGSYNLLLLPIERDYKALNYIKRLVVTVYCVSSGKRYNFSLSKVPTQRFIIPSRILNFGKNYVRVALKVVYVDGSSFEYVKNFEMEKNYVDEALSWFERFIQFLSQFLRSLLSML